MSACYCYFSRQEFYLSSVPGEFLVLSLHLARQHTRVLLQAFNGQSSTSRPSICHVFVQWESVKCFLRLLPFPFILFFPNFPPSLNNHYVASPPFFYSSLSFSFSFPSLFLHLNIMYAIHLFSSFINYIKSTLKIFKFLKLIYLTLLFLQKL